MRRPAAYNLWRAPTDNDRNIRREWEKAGYDRALTKTYGVSVRKENGDAVIRCSLSLTPVFIQRILTVEAVYRISPSGRIDCRLDTHKTAGMPCLPRFGVRMFLPGTFRELEYFGYGPLESYCDKHRASYRGLFRSKVSEQYVDYVKPQENGSHFGVEYLKLSDGENAAVIAAEHPFCFSALEYTQEELTAKRHDFELERAESTVLCVDYRQAGIGSNSCGPELLPQYRFDSNDFSFRFSFQPC